MLKVQFVVEFCFTSYLFIKLLVYYFSFIALRSFLEHLKTLPIMHYPYTTVYIYCQLVNLILISITGHRSCQCGCFPRS